MLLSWSGAGPSPVTIKLTVNHGVALVQAGTNLIVGAASTPGTINAAGDTATWNQPAPAAGVATLDMEVDWRVVEPMQPVWQYDAFIEVRDATGALLPGRAGGNNPMKISPCQIGPAPPNVGDDDEPINIA